MKTCNECHKSLTDAQVIAGQAALLTASRFGHVLEMRCSEAFEISDAKLIEAVADALGDEEFGGELLGGVIVCAKCVMENVVDASGLENDDSDDEPPVSRS